MYCQFVISTGDTLIFSVSDVKFLFKATEVLASNHLAKTSQPPALGGSPAERI